VVIDAERRPTSNEVDTSGYIDVRARHEPEGFRDQTPGRPGERQ
jgi:hypothetical protein